MGSSGDVVSCDNKKRYSLIFFPNFTAHAECVLNIAWGERGFGVTHLSPCATCKRCDLQKRSHEVTIDCDLNISIHIQDDSRYTRVEDAISSKWLPQFAQRVPTLCCMRECRVCEPFLFDFALMPLDFVSSETSDTMHQWFCFSWKSP